MKNGKLILALSILNLVFWILSQEINVYQYTILGAIFEILWLPCLLGIFLLPVWTLWNWYKEKFSIQTYYPHSFALQIALVIYLYIISIT